MVVSLCAFDCLSTGTGCAAAYRARRLHCQFRGTPEQLWVTETMTLSTFVQRPTSALVLLDGGDDVLLTRRDGEDLRMQRECDVRDRAVTVSAVGREFAWASILSLSEANEFAVDSLAALCVSASLGNYAHVSTVVQAWKSSAEIKSDPALLARMKGRLRDEELIIAADPRLDDVRGFGG